MLPFPINFIPQTNINDMRGRRPGCPTHRIHESKIMKKCIPLRLNDYGKKKKKIPFPLGDLSYLVHDPKIATWSWKEV